MKTNAQDSYAAHPHVPVERAAPPVHKVPTRKFEGTTTSGHFHRAHAYGPAKAAERPPPGFRIGEGEFDSTTQYTLNFVGRTKTPTKRQPAPRASIHTSGHAFVGESEAKAMFRQHAYSRREPLRPDIKRDLNPDTRAFSTEASNQYSYRTNEGPPKPINSNYTTLKAAFTPFEGSSTAQSHYVHHQAPPAQICRPVNNRDLDIDQRDFMTEARARYVNTGGGPSEMLKPPPMQRDPGTFYSSTTSGSTYTHWKGALPAVKVLQPAAVNIDPQETRDFVSVAQQHYIKHPTTSTRSTKPVMEYRRTADDREFVSEAKAQIKDYGYQVRESFAPVLKPMESKRFYPETTASTTFVAHPPARTRSCKPELVSHLQPENREFVTEASRNFSAKNDVVSHVV
jgi:hypothetical protein